MARSADGRRRSSAARARRLARPCDVDTAVTVIVPPPSPLQAPNGYLRISSDAAPPAAGGLTRPAAVADSRAGAITPSRIAMSLKVSNIPLALDEPEEALPGKVAE